MQLGVSHTLLGAHGGARDGHLGKLFSDETILILHLQHVWRGLTTFVVPLEILSLLLDRMASNDLLNNSIILILW